MLTHPTSLTFAGGAGTVTGSKFLVTHGTTRVLLDCGIFQGLAPLWERNWAPPPFDPRTLTAVVLSHAHLDHVGYLPVLVREGFTGPVYCTPATASLLEVTLRDTAQLGEEDAQRAHRYELAASTSGAPTEPATRPLFDLADVERALARLVTHGYEAPLAIADDIRLVFRRAGHILGSATVELGLGARRLVFSGDLGRWGRPILRDPELVPEADILLVESTHARDHHRADPDAELVRVVNAARERGGVLVVPAFAVGRTQELLWRLSDLVRARRIAPTPIWVDSPMAVAVTDIYCRHPEEHDLDMQRLLAEGRCPLRVRDYFIAREPDESRSLAGLDGPSIIIAGNGMATGGRVLEHLLRLLPEPKNTVLLVGFQAEGTRGRALRDGASSVRIHGHEVPVRAAIETIDGLSAHADRDELTRWLRGFTRPPARTFVVHGEPNAAEAMVSLIAGELGWRAEVAVDGVTVDL